LVAKFVKYRSITYIPSCHFLSEVTNNGLIARVKDFVNILYYNLVNEFITINDFNKRLILQRGVKSKIHTVPNGIEFDKYKIYNKNKARKMLNLLEEKINIALVGRVQLWNKGHDILLKMVNKYKNELKNYKFIIVGTGEDLESFGQQVKELGLVEYFTFLGHQRDLSAVYSAIDGIIIPSRFEAGAGTPMVLLEALYYKLPIVMTNLPDMDAYLPINSLFKKGNVDDFFEKIITIDAKIISESKRNEIVVKHSLDNFQKEFEKVILKHE
ncbi:MAG: hypothetical protein QG567_591, partial [Campylobacterota bacterium]|nr:hypothetical protein [Campylobacterota bacterium]